MWSRLSRLKASEVTIRIRCPRAAQTRASDVPVLPLWYQANIVIAQKNVGNIKVDASGDWSFVKNLTVEK